MNVVKWKRNRKKQNSFLFPKGCMPRNPQEFLSASSSHRRPSSQLTGIAIQPLPSLPYESISH